MDSVNKPDYWEKMLGMSKGNKTKQKSGLIQPKLIFCEFVV